MKLLIIFAILGLVALEARAFPPGYLPGVGLGGGQFGGFTGGGSSGFANNGFGQQGFQGGFNQNHASSDFVQKTESHHSVGQASGGAGGFSSGGQSSGGFGGFQNGGGQFGGGFGR